MIQGTGKFVQDREKFDKENFEKAKRLQLSWGKFQGTEHFVRDRG